MSWAPCRKQIVSPRAFVATVTTRRAINELRSARARRESYVGEWLPEPIITDSSDDPAHRAEMADSLSLAMLVLLESLSPEQRAVLLLHDVFDYDHAQIAEIIGKAKTTCASSRPAPESTSSSAALASKRPASSATNWQPGSSPRPSKAISPGSRRCWLTTWSSQATAAAKSRLSRVRCADAVASRA
jgi:Sigma-70, region 4